MTLYRAVPISQRDGSALANSNCRMAAIATGIDYQTRGELTSSGADMRARQGDQSGGTDSGDAAEAWRSYGHDLRVRDGALWVDVLEDLEAGRLVHLDVWHAACGGPALSGSGQYGHTLAIAPERSGDRWLTADPWASPAAWVWWEEALLRAGAEEWGAQLYTSATEGPPARRDGELLARMRLAGRVLMGLFRPETPAPFVLPEADTAGAGGVVMFTTTAAPAAAPGEEASDVSYNVAPITTHRSVIVRNCAELYSDVGLSSAVDVGSEAQPLGFMGSTASAHVVAKGDLVLYVNRADVLEIVAHETEYQ